MKKAFFRTDGSQQIGMGHVVRCLALAQRLRKYSYEIAFVTKPYDENVIAKVQGEGFIVHLFPMSCSLEEDRERTVALLKQNGKSVLIVDWREMDAEFQLAVKKTGVPLVVIDELGGGHFRADVVINQNVYAPGVRYSTEPYTRLFLGPRYALLREEFVLRRGRYRSIPDGARNILVTLGGSDPDNQTLKVVEAVASLESDLKTIVVVGAYYSRYESLIQYINKEGQGRFVVRSNVDDMAGLMQWADLAVSAGGSTCWELACLGVPNLILILAADQERNGKELEKSGISVNLGWWKNVSSAAIAAALKELINDGESRRKMSQAGQGLVDGRGADRMAEVIKRL